MKQALIFKLSILLISVLNAVFFFYIFAKTFALWLKCFNVMALDLQPVASNFLTNEANGINLIT